MIFVLLVALLNGIDSSAHLGAIDYMGKTIAVLGGGINNISPKENVGLYNKIIENDGLVISEYDVNAEAESRNFPIRNRIIAGLSALTIVVEAKFRSGSSITARYAKEQGKKVFCLPSNLGVKNGVGTNNLIANGAKILTSINDIFKELDISNKPIEHKNKFIKNEYKNLYGILSYMPMNLNDVIKLSKMQTYEVMPLLSMMELEGLVKCLPGGKIKKED